MPLARMIAIIIYSLLRTWEIRWVSWTGVLDWCPKKDTGNFVRKGTGANSCATHVVDVVCMGGPQEIESNTQEAGKTRRKLFNHEPIAR